MLNDNIILIGLLECLYAVAGYRIYQPFILFCDYTNGFVITGVIGSYQFTVPHLCIYDGFLYSSLGVCW